MKHTRLDMKPQLLSTAFRTNPGHPCEKKGIKGLAFNHHSFRVVWGAREMKGIKGLAFNHHSFRVVWGAREMKGIDGCHLRQKKATVDKTQNPRKRA